MRATFTLFALWLALQVLPAAQPSPPPHVRDARAVAEVMAGERKTANAAWWGFDAHDATETLQAAIDSGATNLIIPCLGKPWVIRPIRLASGQELVLEPGVQILARPGEFLGPGDSLFTATGCSNLVIRGYGACLRMRKQDYQRPPYQRAEWRMGIALRGCRHVLIEGLRVESTGGDGFYIDAGPNLGWSEDITLRDCVAYDNHRQGVSVISAENLLIENCSFLNTWGTAPEAGIDLEPDTADQRLVNCVIRNSLFENNNGHQILIYLKPLSAKSQPVSIRFENCLARMRQTPALAGESFPTNGIQGEAGIAVGEIKDDGPRGTIEFVNCVTENTSQEGARIYDKSSRNARVRFLNCSFHNPWTGSSAHPGGPRAPILLQLRHAERTASPGGVDFLNCYVSDPVSRPALWFDEGTNALALHDVRGNILAADPGPATLHLGTKTEDVELSVTRIVW